MQVLLAEQLALALGDLATGIRPASANEDTGGCSALRFSCAEQAKELS